MTEDVKPDKIKKTQESLSKLIKKPPLTDKLLRKPPFRFLHDIVTSVMRETGFLEGVFSPQELNSENIKDRDGKINFLDKLIANIKSVTGSSISAKPSKIIAGLEVNKTLDLLLALAKAVDIKLNGSKGNEKSSSSKVNDNKDSKKSTKNIKDDKNDATKKKRDDSKGREAKKKSEAKTKAPEKKKMETIKTDSKNVKSETPNNNNESSQPQVTQAKELPLQGSQNGTEEKITENGGEVNSEEKLQENIVSPSKRPPCQKERPPSQKERPPSHKERPPSTDRRSAKKSLERQSSSRQNSMDTVSSETKISLERSSSSNRDNVQPDTSLNQAQAGIEKTPSLPDKVPLEQIVQISSDSNLSSQHSEKLNGSTSPEINGDLSSLEASEKPERRARISSVNSRMERYLSAKNEAKTEQQVGKPLEKVEENDKPEEPPKTAKIKRPQSAKMRPGSSRQRKPDEKAPVSEEKIGQVVLGQGESVDVMGSAPISAPSAKGRRMLSGRPMSARPGAPKPKDRGQVNTSDTPSGSEEVKPIVLIEDNKDIDEDEDNLVTVEKEPVQKDEDKGIEESLDLNLDESNQGALVSQILESKKELEDTKKAQWQSPYQQRTNVEIDWEARSRSRRDALAKEVKTLRDGIQTLTRSSNPLGKLFDFLQEDVELMQSELQDWAKTNTQLQKDIQLQSKQTEELLSPLKKQLSDLDLLIEHEQESIRRVKSNIYLNTTKLDNLLKINPV